MKSKKLFLPVIILIAAVFTMILCSVVSVIAKKPTVTEHEFPFSITYELNGGQFVRDEVVELYDSFDAFVAEFINDYATLTGVEGITAGNFYGKSAKYGLYSFFNNEEMAAKWGWEMAFIIIGALGFVWMGFWQFIYKKPEQNPAVNAEELAYILSDEAPAEVKEDAPVAPAEEKKVSLWQSFKYRQTWAFIVGKFMTDGVWWFFLFWMPSYLKTTYGLASTDIKFQLALGVLYLIVMISIAGGYLPTLFVDKKKMEPYSGRMLAMLIFAFFPLVALAAQPLAHASMWWPVVLIGIAGAAHQAWSANLFSTIGDMFPKKMIATITGIGGMAGGIGSFLIQKSAGALFDYSDKVGLILFGFEGKEAGYMIMFSFCAVAYLIGWVVMKLLVPKYRPIEL